MSSNKKYVETTFEDLGLYYYLFASDHKSLFQSLV